MTPSNIKHFYSKVIITSSCWGFSSAQDKDGYHQVSYKINGKYKQFKAHRLMLVTLGCDITDKIVMHTCDNPSCVNPDHLRIGTVADNNLDKLIKNRQPRQKGSTNGYSKLTDDDVRYIKQHGIVGYRVGYNNGSNIKQLAIKFNVHPETIRFILVGKTWKHI